MIVKIHEEVEPVGKSYVGDIFEDYSSDDERVYIVVKNKDVRVIPNELALDFGNGIVKTENDLMNIFGHRGEVVSFLNKVIAEQFIFNERYKAFKM